MTLGRLIFSGLLLLCAPAQSSGPNDEMVPGHSRKRVPIQPIEHMSPPPINKSLKDSLEEDTDKVVAAATPQRVPIVRLHIPRALRGAVPQTPTSILFQLPDSLLEYLFIMLDDCRDQSRLARTCTKLNEFLKSLPFAPCHFQPVIFRGIHPEDRPSIPDEGRPTIPLSEFAYHFRLYTTQGRREFLKTYSIDGFVDMVKGDRHNGYLLGKPYIKARDVIRPIKTEYERTGRTQSVRLAVNFFVFPPEFCDLDFLGSITFDDCNVVALPPQIGRLHNLETLIITNGFVRTIPESIGGLTILTRLNLRQNLIARLPDSMSRLTALTELDLQENLLREIPPCLIALTSLTTLNLSQNRIDRIPSTIGQMRRLKNLYLSNEAPLKPNDEKEKLKPPRVFISRVPFEIGSISNLEKLYLSGNRLSDLPISFYRLSSLQELDLSSTLIEDFPIELLHLCGLKRLDFRDTLISKIPVQLTKLTALEHLNIRDTGVIDVPPQIKQMTQLTQLVQDEVFTF